MNRLLITLTFLAAFSSVGFVGCGPGSNTVVEPAPAEPEMTAAEKEAFDAQKMKEYMEGQQN